MRWEPGRVVVRRSWRGGRITLVNLTVVAADDDRVVGGVHSGEMPV